MHEVVVSHGTSLELFASQPVIVIIAAARAKEKKKKKKKKKRALLRSVYATPAFGTVRSLVAFRLMGRIVTTLL